MNFVDAARACVSGSISFAEFVEKTDRRWQWWAKRLARSGIPAWLDIEDIRQDLLLEAWRASNRFDVSKANTVLPSQFIEVAAKNRAKKQVHRARGDNRHTWEWGPAKFEIPASALVRENEDGDDVEIFDIPVEPDQDRDRERREAVMTYARKQETMRDFFGVQALAEAEGDIDHAAQLLWNNLDVRLFCRFPNDGTARMVVGRLAAKISAAA